MFWKAFVYLALPPGAFLAALLLSGQGLAMSFAGKVLASPVKIGSATLSMATFMTAVCAVLAFVSYSGLQMSEGKLAQLEGSRTLVDAAYVADTRSKCFHSGRNFYASLLGLTLWGASWRLKGLHDRKQLGPPRVGAPRASAAKRIAFVVAGLLMLALADVPLCRINYNLQLLTFVTPRKMMLGGLASSCKGVYFSDVRGQAGNKCTDFCADVEALSQERLATIKWARNWHVLGAFAARVFDDARGVEQGEARIEELFRKKSCAEVLASVDKSNNFVNGFCYVLAAVAVIGAFMALSNALDGGDGFDMATPTAPPHPSYGNAPKED